MVYIWHNEKYKQWGFQYGLNSFYGWWCIKTMLDTVGACQNSYISGEKFTDMGYKLIIEIPFSRINEVENLYPELFL